MNLYCNQFAFGLIAFFLHVSGGFCQTTTDSVLLQRFQTDKILHLDQVISLIKAAENEKTSIGRFIIALNSEETGTIDLTEGYKFARRLEPSSLAIVPILALVAKKDLSDADLDFVEEWAKEEVSLVESKSWAGSIALATSISVLREQKRVTETELRTLQKFLIAKLQISAFTGSDISAAGLLDVHHVSPNKKQAVCSILRRSVDQNAPVLKKCSGIDSMFLGEQNTDALVAQRFEEHASQRFGVQYKDVLRILCGSSAVDSNEPGYCRDAVAMALDVCILRSDRADIQRSLPFLCWRYLAISNS
jgi:hypothetical protein